MRRFLKELFSAPFRLVLVVSFSFVAATTIATGAYVISRTISDYLTQAMDERLDRDMRLAETLYATRLREVARIADRLALDPLVGEHLAKARAGNAAARATIDRQIANELSAPILSGNYFVAVLAVDGAATAARLLPATGERTRAVEGGNWASLSAVKEVLHTGRAIAATDVIPTEVLADTDLSDQACIEILDTPKASPSLCDPREGRAGLALLGIAPVGGDGRVIGAVVAFHLFNNDFTLVDQIKDAVGADTVTIFHGDLRVSTNVLTQYGSRAIGTRMSQEVSQVVLGQGKSYIGTAFVVNENYIARYDPLADHTGQVIGSLYVGVRQASFFRLVDTLNQRVGLIALITVVLAFLLAVLVSHAITGPIKELVEANRKLAQGDMTVRVPVRGAGELGVLASSFNLMVDTLWSTRLAQAEKLAALGQLAAGVAHELNNPLGTVLLYSDILLKECDGQDPHRADLEMIVSEAKRCKHIVADLLNFARQNQVIPQPTDLNALIRSVVEVERKRDVYHKITIVTNLDPALPKIEADPAQLRQVFINLMTNAVEAMPQGGQLSLNTWSEPAGMVTVLVKDTGIGIAPENLSKLFTPFFTTKPVGKGTGLGLAIVYGIIKMHRGQINVQSQVGKSTTFTINLPIKLPPAELAGDTSAMLP